MIDVCGAIDQRIVQTRPARKSHGGLSVSQVSNGCPRSVWHELRAGKGKDFDANTKVKMEIGLIWEEFVLECLKANGFTTSPYGREVAIFGTFENVSKGVFRGPGGTKALLMDADEFDADPKAYAAKDELIGHLEHVVSSPTGELWQVEVKTTHMFGKPFWGSLEELMAAQGQYILQTVANSKAVGAQAALHVVDRSSGVRKDFHPAVDRYWPLFLARWERMLPAIGGGESEPEIDVPTWTRNAKGLSYLCRQCPATKCPEYRA